MPDLTLTPQLRRSRWLLIALPIVAIVIGGYTLISNLPFDYYPYFWDGAQVFQEVSDPGFSKPGPLNARQYTLQKYAYSILIHYAKRSLGLVGSLVVNLCWYCVMLAMGIWAFYRRRGPAHSLPWAGMLTFAAAMITLPFIHKYIGMTNPTIQSMALWFALLLSYEFISDPPATLKSRIMLPGILCALLVLTDFPKWAVILTPGIFIVEWVSRWSHVKSRWSQFAGAVVRTVLIMSWALAGFLLLCFLIPNYLRNNVGVTLFGEATKAEMVRLSLSWNFPIFLWVLGGLFVVIFIAVFRGRFTGRPIRQSPALVLALAEIGLFSCLIWPRNARMYAVVMPYAVFLFGRIVQQIFDTLRTDTIASDRLGRRWVVAGFAGALILLGSLVVRAPGAGACFTVPTGVRKMNLFVANDPRVAADSLLGAYIQPPFQLGVPPGHRWHYVPGYMWSDMRWVCSGDFIDEVIIEEQFLHGRVPLSWRTRQMRMLGTFRGQPAVAQFSNRFYASRWYLVESNFEDGQLAFMLRRAAELENPVWRLHFVAGIAGDSLPPGITLDTLEAEP